MTLGSALVVLLVACGRGGAPAGEAEGARRGREIYAFEGCGSCHGQQQQGTKNAPPLAGLRKHWTADELARYLRQPGSYPKDGRLRRVAERFPAEMAGLPAAEPGRLHDLVTFLLSR